MSSSFANHPLFGNFQTASHTPSSTMMDFYRSLRTLADHVHKQGLRDGSFATLTDYETGQPLESAETGFSRQIRFYSLDQEKKTHDRIWFISPIDRDKIQICDVSRQGDSVTHQEQKTYISTYDGLLQTILEQRRQINDQGYPAQKASGTGQHRLTFL